MVPAPLHDRFVEPARYAHANEGALDPDRLEFRMLRTKGRSEIRLALRPARSSDGDALQSYVRGLSPQGRYNRFLGAANELSASELARTLAANGRDTLTLLLLYRSRHGRPLALRCSGGCRGASQIEQDGFR